jgi:dethiobiotin synthetase
VLDTKGLFVTGTDTGVGKTRIAAALTRMLRSCGMTVRVRKPVETGCVRTQMGLAPQDAKLLSSAAGDLEPLEVVCPYRFEPAVSPERAARLSGFTLTLEQLIQACRPLGQGVLLVEGAGGFYSPIADRALNADLAEALKLPVLIVAADRLGVIHQTLTTVEAVIRRRLSPIGIVLNRIPQRASELDNLEDLRRFTHLEIFPVPFTHAEAELMHALLPLCEKLKRFWLALPEQ